MEVEWTVGPIPIEDKHGKEVVLRYTSSLDSGQTYSWTFTCGSPADLCCLVKWAVAFLHLLTTFGVRLRIALDHTIRIASRELGAVSLSHLSLHHYRRAKQVRTCFVPTMQRAVLHILPSLDDNVKAVSGTRCMTLRVLVCSP